MSVIQNQRFRPNGEVPPPAATKATGSGARKPARKAPPPVTAHRLFPAVVGLWFAALFGIGSFVVPPTLFESVVTATGLPSVLPAAAPPLGFTARALLALVLTFAGGLAGLMIGLRFARASAPVAQRKTFPGQPVRAAAPVAPSRRKVEARPQAADENSSAPGLPPFGPATRAPLRASETFAGIEPLGTPSTTDLHDFTREQAFSPPVALPGYPGPFATPPVDDEPVFDAAAPAAPFAQPAPFGMSFLADEPEEVAEPAPPALLADMAAEEDGVTAEPVSLSEPEAPEPEPETPAVSPATVLERAMRGERHKPDALIRAPLAQLGTVQLIERLAIAMAEWRDRTAAAPLRFEAPVAPPVSTLVPAAVRIEDGPVAAPVEPDPAPHAAEPEVAAPFAPTSFAPAPFAAPAVETAPEIAAETVAATPAEAPARPAMFEPPMASQARYDWGDDEDEPVLPPRFLTSAPEAPPQPAAFEPRFAAADEAELADEQEDEGPEGDDCADLSVEDMIDEAPAADDPAAEESDPYPSLLSIGQPLLRAEPRRQPLLPEADAPAEPEARFATPAPSAMAPFAQPGAAPVAVPGTVTGLPVAAPAYPVEPIDPVEADLALRTALANLQRMSGGAR